MIKVIIHGTIGGHNAYPPSERYTIDTGRMDLRAQILLGAEGYYIQMTPDGVWVSKARGMMDSYGDSRDGFVAASIFLPPNKRVLGNIIKDKLDYLLDKYLSGTDGILTKELANWSFIEQVSNELNSCSTHWNKPTNINYIANNQYAYIAINTEKEIINYLGKPFQLEYGQYEAVFIGTNLQKNDSANTPIPLNIDINNEVYDIHWRGNVSLYKNLPCTIRKKDIESGIYTFERRYYRPQSIPYAGGHIDEKNLTLELTVPDLKAETNQLHLKYNIPDAIVNITVKNTATQQFLSSNKITNDIISFEGCEFEQEWDFKIALKDGYQCNRTILKPSLYVNNYYEIHIEKMQTVSLYLWENNRNTTQKWESNTVIQQKSSRETPKMRINDANCFIIEIHEGEDFEQHYVVELKSSYYRIGAVSRDDDGLYRAEVYKQNTSSTQPKKNTITLEFPKCIKSSSITAQCKGKKLSIRNNSIDIDRDSIKHIKFSYKGKELKTKCQNNKIKILAPKSRKWMIGLYGILSIIGLCSVVITTLELTNSIDLFPINKPIKIYPEIEIYLKSAKDDWRYKDISKFVELCIEKGLDDKSHRQHEKYERLIWLEKSRAGIDGYKIKNKDRDEINDFDRWLDNIKSISEESCPFDSQLRFMRDILEAKKEHQERLWKEIINDRNAFEGKGFKDIKEIWKECKKDPQTNTKSDNSSSKVQSPPIDTLPLGPPLDQQSKPTQRGNTTKQENKGEDDKDEEAKDEKNEKTGTEQLY